VAYCSQSDLEVTLGGAHILVQLLDKNGDGTADSAMVTACLDRATAEIDSRIQVAVDLSALSAPYPNQLIYKTADVAAYEAWKAGAEGQVIPDAVQSRYDDAINWATQVATRRATLGVVPRPTSGQIVEQIDRNPIGATQHVPTFLSTRGPFW